MAEPKIIRLRWPAWCLACGLRMNKGERAEWRGAGQIVHHQACPSIPTPTLSEERDFISFLKDVGIAP